jgi:hypothetical protein
MLAHQVTGSLLAVLLFAIPQLKNPKLKPVRLLPAKQTRQEYVLA